MSISTTSTTNARFAAKFEKKAKLLVNKEFSALAVVPNQYRLTFAQVGNAIDCEGSDEYLTTAAAGEELLAQYIDGCINSNDYSPEQLELVKKISKKIVMSRTILLQFVHRYIHPEMEPDVLYVWFVHLGCRKDNESFTAVAEWLIGPLVGAVEQAWYECERESTQQRRRRAHAAVLSLLPNLKRRLPSSRFAQALGLAARELTTRRRRHPLYSPSRRNGVYIPSGALTSLASPPRRRSARLSGIPPSPSVSQIDVSSISSSSPSPLDGDDEIISSGIGSVSAGPSRRRSARLSALHTTQTLSGITSSASSACLSGWQYHG